MRELKRVCVFCGSSAGNDPRYAEAARSLGSQLAAKEIGLVYGGGNVGLMGLLADAVMAGGGEVIGVIPHGLLAREVGHRGLTQLHIVDSMHERKAKMAELADAFIALPGGFGTLEELFEVVTWSLLGIHRKPFALYDVAGYYDSLIAFLDRATKDGFIRPVHRSLVSVATGAEEALAQLSSAQLPFSDKWLTGAES